MQPCRAGPNVPPSTHAHAKRPVTSPDRIPPSAAEHRAIVMEAPSGVKPPQREVAQPLASGQTLTCQQPSRFFPPIPNSPSSSSPHPSYYLQANEEGTCDTGVGAHAESEWCKCLHLHVAKIHWSVATSHSRSSSAGICMWGPGGRVGVSHLEVQLEGGIYVPGHSGHNNLLWRG